MNWLDYYFSSDLDAASMERASKVPMGVAPTDENVTAASRGTPLKVGNQPNTMYPSSGFSRKSEGGGGDSGGAGGSTGGGGDTGEGGPGAAAGGGSGGHGGDTGGLGAGNTGGGESTPSTGGGLQPPTTPAIPDKPNVPYPENPPTYPGTNTPMPMVWAPGTGWVPGWTNAGGPVPIDPTQKPGDKLDEFTTFLKEIGADQYDFWKQNYKPLEQQQIAETKRFMTPEYANQQAAQAGADVTGAFAGKRAATEADLQSMGLGDPSQGRYQAYRRGLDIAEAGTLASAKTGARLNAERTGYGALSGLVNQGNVKTAAAAGAGQAAGGMAATAAGLNQRQNEFANTFNQRNYEFGKSQELDRYKIDQGSESSESSGYGELAGLAATAAILAFSSKQYKTQKKRYKGGLDALDKMPVDQWKYKKGIADEGHHIGPYAEDFQKATGKGDGKTIMHQDAIGVTMAAVKELHGRVKQLEGKKGKKLPRTSDPSSEMNQPEGAQA